MRYLVSVQKFVDADSPEEATNKALPEIHIATTGNCQGTVMIEVENMKTKEVKLWTLHNGKYE